MTTREQVNLVNESDVLAGVHGAGLTNMMFLDKVKVLLKFRQWRQIKQLFFPQHQIIFKLYYFFAKQMKTTFMDLTTILMPII